MKSPRLVFVLLLTCLAGLVAAPTAGTGPKPNVVRKTFYLKGKVDADGAKKAEAAVLQVLSVTKIEDLVAGTTHAVVTFDSHVATAHQVAAALATIPSVEVSIRYRVTEFAKNREAVEKALEKQKASVRFEVIDAASGEFALAFLPLAQVNAAKARPYNVGTISRALEDKPPKGLGLKLSAVEVYSAAAATTNATKTSERATAPKPKENAK